MTRIAVLLWCCLCTSAAWGDVDNPYGNVMFVTTGITLSITNNQTTYNLVHGGSTANTSRGTFNSTIAPRTINIARFWCALDAAPAGIAVRTITLESCSTDGCTPAATSLTCAITGSQTRCEGTVAGGVTIPARSRMDVAVANTGTGPVSANLACVWYVSIIS